jgi:hypothetical protein
MRVAPQVWISGWIVSIESDTRRTVGIIPTPQHLRVTDHLSVNTVDEYVLDRIGNDCALAAVEEHLLLCPDCQAAIEATMQLREALRINQHLRPTGRYESRRDISNVNWNAAISRNQ